jgi:hypothetical protein
MKRPPLLRLADLALDGQLADVVRAHRTAGKSWEWIARDLWARTNGEVDVSGQTVRAWAAHLDSPPAPTPDEAAA